MKKGTLICVVTREIRHITRYTLDPHNTKVTRYTSDPDSHHLIWDSLYKLPLKIENGNARMLHLRGGYWQRNRIYKKPVSKIPQIPWQYKTFKQPDSKLQAIIEEGIKADRSHWWASSGGKSYTEVCDDPLLRGNKSKSEKGTFV